MIEAAYKVVGFLVTLGVLVVFHELGHYIVARWCGVKVLRFSVGFGRIVAARRLGRDDTEWALSAIPLGGYVKMADEREGDVAPADIPRAFNRQSVWKRIAIVAAGPIANLLLAVVLYSATFMAGVPGQRAILADPTPGTAAAAAGIRAGDVVVAVDGEAVRSWQDLRWRMTKSQGQDSVVVAVEPAGPHAGDPPVKRTLAIGQLTPSEWEGNALAILGLRTDLGPPLIAELVPGKPGERAGLAAGDRITAIEGTPVRSPSDVAAITNAHPGTALTFTVERAGATQDVRVTPEASEQNGRTIGIAGLKLTVDPAVVERLSITVRYGPVQALEQGARRTWELSVFTLKTLGRIVIGEASLKNISGPLTLAEFAGQSAQAGPLAFVGYLALISISLGVLNLLPVPLLDGGHLLYYFAEVFKGSPVSDRAFEVGQRIGMAMLAVLMALALFNDVSRLF
ncbi:MAG TPA: RIP metalloprotease RseP [Casimicrobiaceae bacterium]|nr:RIP metalloprotease RseP [Casimicrobiaceae bacterium]